MTSHKPSAESIDHSAVQWAARLDARELKAEEQAALQAWLDSDRRCLGALARAQAVLAGGGAQEHRHALVLSRQSMWPSRRWLLAGAALATAGVAGLTLLRQHPAAGESMHVRSERGELRHLPLPDGSWLTLNTQTALDVEFGAKLRRVRLLQGEAFFQVAKDPSRPFIVIGPNAQVRTVGTSYSVRLSAPDAMNVLVSTGRVAIEAVDRERGPFAVLQRYWPGGEGKSVLVDAGQEAN